jgi:hypothetical protein
MFYAFWLVYHTARLIRALVGNIDFKHLNFNPFFTGCFICLRALALARAGSYFLVFPPIIHFAGDYLPIISKVIAFADGH